MSKVLRCAAVAGFLASVAAGAVPVPRGSVAAAPGDASDVPQVAGPDLLRWPVATAPQLTNTGIWSEPPLLVSGALAYRNGEMMYQDFLYDDHGANGTSQDPTIAKPLPLPIGTYSYPSGAEYHNNAADLVELRVKREAAATAFRVTLNSLTNPELVGFTMALGGDALVPRPYPFGANAVGPAAVFLTVHGSVGVLTDALTGLPLPVAATVTVDVARHQFTVVVPHTAWNPGTSKALMAIGVGLWDGTAGQYMVPAATRTATRPGGSGSLIAPTAFFNVGFRLGDQKITRENDWVDASQATALANGNMTPFTINADFGLLASNATDDSAVPTTGTINRILASHFQFGQGIDYIGCAVTAATHCKGRYIGNLQPYTLYVPPQSGTTPYGLTLLLHSLNFNHNQYAGSRHQRQTALRDTGSIVMTTLARGPDGQYVGSALADVFEVWADVAANYPLEPAWTTISGYSMGGFGTFFLSEAYPDLFSRAFSVVGSSYQHTSRLASLRNVPILMWNAAADELVPPVQPEADATVLQSLGYRYELDMFAAEHLTHQNVDEYQPGADFLGTARVEPNPHHVTYVVNPYDRYPEFGMAADHAYWLSGMTVRQVGPEVTAYDSLQNGVVDAFSHGFGRGDATPSGPQAGAGVLTGGLAPLAYTRQYQTWGPEPAAPVENRLRLTLTNVATLTIDVARARVGCDVQLQVTTDGPVSITLAGCGTTRQIPAGSSTGFTSFEPERLFDTRGESPNALRPVAVRQVGGGYVLEVKATDLTGLVPASGVGAVTLNVAVDRAAGPGFVTAYSCGQRKLTASVNYAAGETVSNGVIVPVSPTGTICFYAHAPTDVIVDIYGWFVAGGAFKPVGPERVADTRGESPNAHRSVPVAQIGAGQILELKVTDLPGLVPASGVSAVWLNVAVDRPRGAGFITAYPCGERKLVASVNYAAGQTVSNGVLAPVSATGTVCFYTHATTDIVVDINGWFATGPMLTSVGPQRVFDTRGESPNSLRSVPVRKVGTTPLEVKMTDLPGHVPASGVRAVSLNLAVTNPDGPGYVTVYPCGTRRLIASINFVAGETVSNAVIVPVSATGTVCFYAYAPTDIVVDINGWFSAN
jgi:hypothetical protein